MWLPRQTKIWCPTRNCLINLLPSRPKHCGTRRFDTTEYKTNIQSRKLFMKEYWNQSTVICVHIETLKRTVQYMTWSVMKNCWWTYHRFCATPMHSGTTSTWTADVEKLYVEMASRIVSIRTRRHRFTLLAKSLRAPDPSTPQQGYCTRSSIAPRLLFLPSSARFIDDAPFCRFFLANGLPTTQLTTIPPHLCTILFNTCEANFPSIAGRERWYESNGYCIVSLNKYRSTQMT